MKKHSLITNEQLIETTLDNGLTIFVLEKPGYQKKYAVYATHYGSIDSHFRVGNEESVEVPAGIAHFLEHKLFEEEEGNVFDTFSQFGASVNAYTSYTTTAYLFSTIDHFYDALRELIGFVSRPHLTHENVDKEKGIIEQELRMYDDHPSRKIYKNLLNGLYKKHPLRLDIGGTVESIYQIDVDALLKCYRAFYQPRNMAVFVIGDVNWSQAVDTINDELAKHAIPQATEVERIYPEEPDQINQAWTEEKLAISRPRYFLGFKDKPQLGNGALLKQQIATNLAWRFLAARSSDVQERLLAEDVIDDSFGASFTSSSQYAYSIVGGETDDPKQFDGKLREAIDQLKATKLSEEQLERMKKRAYGSHLGSLNSLDYIANGFLSHYFNGTSLLDFPRLVQQVTSADLSHAMNNFDFSKAGVSLLLPE